MFSFVSRLSATASMAFVALALPVMAHAQTLAQTPVDLIIRDARVVDVKTEQVAPDRAVIISSDTIIAVMADADVAGAYSAPETVDVDGRWVSKKKTPT